MKRRWQTCAVLECFFFFFFFFFFPLLFSIHIELGVVGGRGIARLVGVGAAEAEQAHLALVSLADALLDRVIHLSAREKEKNK